MFSANVCKDKWPFGQTFNDFRVLKVRPLTTFMYFGSEFGIAKLKRTLSGNFENMRALRKGIYISVQRLLYICRLVTMRFVKTKSDFVRLFFS